MKFGDYLKENILNPWRFEYIQYDLLKQDLKQRQLDHEWNQKDELDFSQLFSNERLKVSRFIINFNQQLVSRIEYAQHLLKSSIKNQTSQQQQQAIEFLGNLDNSLKEIIFDVYDFAKYIHLNKMGFKKILKKHKKWTTIEHANKSCYEYQSLDSMLGSNWDTSFYTQASLLRLECQQKFHNSSDNDLNLKRNIPVNATERKIKKYWIHPDHISEVTAIISLHAFVIQPPTKSFNGEKIGQQLFDFSMSNVYLENNDFAVYSDRIAGTENAQTIKCKRYGSFSNDNNATTTYFENEKYNKIYSSCDISSKKRFQLDQNLLNAYCKGEYKIQSLSATPKITNDDDMDEKEAMKLNEKQQDETPTMFASETQKNIVASNLTPIIQCDYQRISFQSSHNCKEMASITLDTNISFAAVIQQNNTDEKEKPFFLSSGDQQSIIQEYFPYAVLEIKIPSDVKEGDLYLEWLKSFTTTSNLVHEIPKFSKYLQGIYQLYSSSSTRLASPEWVELYKQSIPPSVEYKGLSRSRSLRPLVNGKPFICDTLYSAVGNANTEKTHHRENLQHHQQNNKKASVESSSYHSTSHSDDFTAISIKDNKNFKKVMGAPVNEDDYKVVVNMMNEKTEMNYFQQPHQNKSLFFSGFFSSNNKKKNNSKLNILDEDGNPIEYRNQQQQQQPKKKKNNKPLVVKIEPKVFFANERTFISWLQFCALLLTVSLNLLNFGDQVSKICGGIFLFISMMLALYALARFQYRAWQLRHPNQTGRYDDLYGPAVLCILIVAALVINFWLRFKYITEPGQQGGLYASSKMTDSSNSTVY